MIARRPRAKKVKEWTARFRRFNASDAQTVVEFCRTEHVSPPSFYQWRKKLADTSKAPRAPRPKSVSKANGFRELRVVPQLGGNAVTIRLPSGITIELGTDLAVIENVVTQLLDRHGRTIHGKRRTAGGESC